MRKPLASPAECCNGGMEVGADLMVQGVGEAKKKERQEMGTTLQEVCL